MGLLIFFLVLGVVTTVVCVLKGRHFSALFGIGVIGTVIWLLNEVASVSGEEPYAGYGIAFFFTFVVLPLSLLVTIGALRPALAD